MGDLTPAAIPQGFDTLRSEYVEMNGGGGFVSRRRGADDGYRPAVGEVQRPPRPTGRPRSEAARQAVIEAAYALLEEHGIEGFSIDAVARRAGVARTTIYRWWPTKPVLAMASFFEHFGPQLARSDTGNSADDLRALVGSLTRTLAGPSGAVAASVIAHAQSDSETRRVFREEFSEPLRRESRRLLEAGIAAGIFRPDLCSESVVDAFVGAVYLRLLLGSSLTQAWADNLSDTLLHGCLIREEDPG